MGQSVSRSNNLSYSSNTSQGETNSGSSTPTILQSNNSTTKFRSRRLSSISSNLSNQIRRKSFLKHFRRPATNQHSNETLVHHSNLNSTTDCTEDLHFPSRLHQQEQITSIDNLSNSEQNIEQFEDQSSPLLSTPEEDSPPTPPLHPFPVETDSSVSSPILNNDHAQHTDIHEIRETYNDIPSSSPLNSEARDSGLRRETLINNQYNSIASHLNNSLITQFQTLSNLLESVTITTLRRLVQNGYSSNGISLPVDEHQEDSNNPFRVDDYFGSRIDTTTFTDDDETQDTTFMEFLNGLSNENLLHRELGTQLLNNQTLSFFRAFRFQSDIPGRFTTIDLDSLVPVLIVGVVSLNESNNDSNDSNDSEEPTINVSGNHSTNVSISPNSENIEETTESIQEARSFTSSIRSSSMASTPLSYVGTSETTNNHTTTPPSSANDSSSSSTYNNANNSDESNSSYRSWVIIVMAHHYAAADPVLNSMSLFINMLTSYVSRNNNSSSNSASSPLNSSNDGREEGGDFQTLRDSLSRIFNRAKKISKKELEKHNDCLFKFTTDSKKAPMFKHDDNHESLVGLFEPGDRCPICLLDYNEGDSGRYLKCSHNFHQDCIDEWLVSDNSCPICRGEGIRV